MLRTSTGSDPLVLLILASVGLLPGQACGGQSVGEADEARSGLNAGGSGGVGGATGGVGGAGAAPPMTEGPIACSSPSFPFGEEAGFVSCAEGFTHRPTPGRCAQTPYREGEPTNATLPSCGADADCADLDDGRCVGTFITGRRCVSSCETDADCDPGFICFCGSEANTCAPSNCETDADCGEDLLCASYVVADEPCAAYVAFACQLADDTCTASCPAGYACKVDRTSEPISRDCIAQAGVGGTCGRPFLVSGLERLAQATTRDDWCDDEQRLPTLATLTATERLALSLHWQELAVMEHASIAAFARFALELLALGAPQELLEQTSAAMADERRHAAKCFALASAFSGRRIGPGPLPIEGCLAAVDLESVTVTTFLEGCIGETIAAVEARELALATEDPVIRQTLAAIAEDEARHALLAWSFLAWALEHGGEVLAERLLEVLHQETRRRPAPPLGVGLTPEREVALGMPSAAFRANARHHVLENVVKPCLEAFTIGRSTAPTSRRDTERSRHRAAQLFTRRG